MTGYLNLGNVRRAFFWLRILRVERFKSRELPLVRKGLVFRTESRRGSLSSNDLLFCGIS